MPRLSYTEELQCTILEVKAIGGFGTTIDVCLVNGRLKFGQTIVLPGTDGPIVTTIKVTFLFIFICSLGKIGCPLPGSSHAV